MAGPTQSKCDAFVASMLVGSRREWSHVIIKFSHKPDSSQNGALEALGVDVYRNLPVIHSVAARVRGDRLGQVLKLPFVVRVSGDVTVRKHDQFTVGASGADVAFQQYGLTGSGVGVAVVDSGVHYHGDLSAGVFASRIKASVNFVPGADADDHCGHGTFVAGIVAGNAANSTGLTYTKSFLGIARKANIYSVKVLDETGEGTVSQVVAGVQWCIANASTKNIRVINLSLGHPVGESYATDPLCQAVESAWKAGIVVVCAAGNDGRRYPNGGSSFDNEGYGTNYGSIQSPGNDPYVITVGAMKREDDNRKDDRIATYSSRGPSRLDFVLKPDLVAPGNLIISTEAKGSYLATTYVATNEVPWSDYCLVSLGGRSDKYFRMSGTSMAAPVVAGAAAMMLERDPSLTPDTIKVRLMVSADKWLTPAGYADPCAYGAGYLDIPAALQSTLVAGQAALSPQLKLSASGLVIIDPDDAIWGDHAIWGTNTLNDLRAIWGDHAIWGDSTRFLDASHAIWGNGFWTDQATSFVGTDGVDLTAGSIAIQGER